MVEDLGSVIKKGFDTWKANLCICLPFVFSMVLTSIVALIIIGGAILAAVPSLPSLIPHLSQPDKIPPELILPLMLQLIQNIGIVIVAIIISVILVLLINAFFAAGAIGMAKEATETGSTNLSDMKGYGKRKFISLLFADIIVGLIALIGFVFLIPGIVYALPVVTTSPEPTPEIFMPAFAIFMIGILIMSIYGIIVSIMFALPRYSVVIDDLGAIEGVKKAFNMFMKNKLDVFLLWLVALVIGIVVSIILSFIPYIGPFLNVVVSVIVIQPLAVIWWSRFYLSIVKPAGDL
ncbi:MAG: hypothetical protein U9N61_09280 [Euryarchaeota archaeon]|nr:hypothetical protein [Euryarchaeota archaeon]